MLVRMFTDKLVKLTDWKSVSTLSRMLTPISSKLPFEIVIVDDASPDGTQEVAAKLVEIYGDTNIVCLGSLCWSSDF